MKFNSGAIRNTVISTVAIALCATGPLVSAQANGSTPNRVIQMVNVEVEVQKTIDSKKSKVGDPVMTKVITESTLSDGTMVNPGSILSGKIDSITPSENKGDAKMVLTLNKISLKGGKDIWVKAVVVRVSSLASNFGDHPAGSEPEENRPASGSMGVAGSKAIINSPTSGPSGAHPIDGLTLTGSANDPTSATLTQVKKNIHLSNNTILDVSVAAMPGS